VHCAACSGPPPPPSAHHPTRGTAAARRREILRDPRLRPRRSAAIGPGDAAFAARAQEACGTAVAAWCGVGNAVAPRRRSATTPRGNSRLSVQAQLVDFKCKPRDQGNGQEWRVYATRIQDHLNADKGHERTLAARFCVG